MFLESISSIVNRFKKRKPLDAHVNPLPLPAKLSPPTPVDSSPPGGTNVGASPDNTPNLRIPPSNQAFFPGAHDFVINNPTMITILNSGGAALHLLAEKSMAGAEVDSSARDPPPKCHPDTRKTLRARIGHWVTDPHRRWRMLWVMGPAGVGKSAIAQTIAEECKASGRLGAALFFSRPNHRNDPERVIPTLVYQLAVKDPEYKRIITRRLANDPKLLEKNRRTLFKELIIEPFQILMTQHPARSQQPLLIVLDGLDECKSEKAQCEFIELISTHVRQMEKFPLLWMICSRPEWHLKYLLSEPDFQVTCEREEIVIDDAEAQRDVSRVLRAGFRNIQRQYRNRLEPDWPPESHIRIISTAASGHFAFGSTIIRFISDEHSKNPSKQLDICIRFLGGFGAPGSINPLHALDLLYRQILSDVPVDILPTTLRILGMSILYAYPRLSTQDHANFLCIDRDTFYYSLERLHSVLDVPPATHAHQNPIRFYHASFGDYLNNPNRSRGFCITESAVHYDVAIHSLQWQRPACMQQDLDSPSCPKLEWLRIGNSQEEILSILKNFSLIVGWKACCRISDKDVPSIVAELERFDFGSLDKTLMGFGEFLSWLHKLGHRNNSLIRPSTKSDVAEKTKHLRVTHYAEDPIAYISAFGVSTESFQRFGEYTLQLRLGRADNAREIVVNVRRNHIEEEDGKDEYIVPIDAMYSPHDRNVPPQWL